MRTGGPKFLGDDFWYNDYTGLHSAGSCWSTVEAPPDGHHGYPRCRKVEHCCSLD